MSKAKFIALNRGDLDFSDNAPNEDTVYFEKVDNNFMQVHTSAGDGYFGSTADPELTFLKNQNGPKFKDNGWIASSLYADGGAGGYDGVYDNHRDANGWKADLNWTLSRDGYYLSRSSAQRIDSFENDNSNYGGNGPAMSQDVIDLLDAMGRPVSTRRYGKAFTIYEVTKDTTGTFSQTLPGVSVANSFSLRVRGHMVTAAVWIRPIHKKIIIRRQYYPEYYRDDVKAPTHFALEPSDGWTHISCVGEPGSQGYSYPLIIQAESEARYQIACLYVAVGEIRLKKSEHKFLIYNPPGIVV